MTAKARSLPAFVWDNFRLQRFDFVIMPLAVAGMWGLCIGLLALISAMNGDWDILGMGIPGMLAVVMAVIMSLIMSYSRIWLEFRIGVQLSVPRRRMIAAELTLSLAAAAEALAAAWLLNRVWLLAANTVSTQVKDVVALMPMWGWAMLLVLPTALGTVAGAVVLRFGTRGGWVVYALVLLTCFTLGEGIDRVETALELQVRWAKWLVAALPGIGWALAAAALTAAVLLLRRVPVND